MTPHANGYWDRVIAILTLDALCVILLRLLRVMRADYSIDLLAWGAFAVACIAQLYALCEWDQATRPKKEAPPPAEPKEPSDH